MESSIATAEGQPLRLGSRWHLPRVFDVWEFARFFLTGILATLGNVAAVWAANRQLSYELSLLAGLATGFIVSFGLGKFFAFRSFALERTSREMVRFSIVYAVGAALCWVVALVCGKYVLPSMMPVAYAGLAGALCGASVMVFTSYFGHKFFTYRNVVGDRTAIG